MGHKVNLDSVYLSPTENDLFEEFQKGIPDLAINDSERLKIRNQQLEKEKSELEKEKWKVTNLENDMKNVNVILEEMQKRFSKK